MKRVNTATALTLFLCLHLGSSPAVVVDARAQDTVTGAFEGTVTSGESGLPVPDAEVQIINRQTGIAIPKRSDSRGRFYQGLLPPGVYTIRVAAPGFVTREVVQRLFITRTGEVVPVPVSLDPVSAAPAPGPTPAVPAGTLTEEDTDVRAKINTGDARRDGAFSDREIETLPLGGTTFVRTFDELAFLAPGAALPPQTLGSVAGPGVGAGVGSAGQFAVNGLRSRANNFTVDGSDNNDEDIGVRRQGFVALNSQTVESVKEYQVITLLAPAKFGRNIGAQVNAVSKSGGDETHGTVYGFFNAAPLNARNFFDTTSGGGVAALRAGNDQPVLLDGRPLRVQNQGGGKDSFTFWQAGAVLGGPLRSKRFFYFLAAEGQRTIASEEHSFAVPTIEQRGVFRSGATGIFSDPFTGAPTATIPTGRNGAALFSLFPFPNNPQGVFGANTYTQVLPANARGQVLSGKLDYSFNLDGRQQSLTERYNYTDDNRIVPVTGGALFSSLKPRVRTQNTSFFYNSEVSAPNAVKSIFNQVRLSYGRTRLVFDEARDRDHLIPSELFPNIPFLLNAPELLNITTPPQPGVANTGPVLLTAPGITVEQELGPLGQVSVAGFSPVGVDVYNFPQQRVNNTYQAADELTLRARDHAFAFGADVRRSELNSDLPRNARPLATFNGAPRLIFADGVFRPPASADLNQFIRPEDLVASGAASNFYLTLITAGTDAKNSLRYYQMNFYAQDEWRVRRQLSVSYGLRYEYNTPVRELNRRIEDTFNSPALDLAPGLRGFIEGRTRIFDPDRNNLAPRVGVAYLLNPPDRGRATVIRAGYGIFFDQILGAVVSQSRNVYPTFLTLNFGGLNASQTARPLTFFNPGRTGVVTQTGLVTLTQPGTLNQLNQALTLGTVLPLITRSFPAALGATLPARRIETPTAQHYALTVERQFGMNLAVSVAYVGTRARHLLRFTTPNLGPGSTLVPTAFNVLQEQFNVPRIVGLVRGLRRPVSGLGAVNRFESTASSSYHGLQLQVRGRLRRALQYQAAYTFSKVTDDVSDVFDLAGAPALPQDSFDLAAERGPANFDVRHRFAFNFIHDLSVSRRHGAPARLLFNNLRLAGTGSFQSGQPFTVNSIFDVNLDGNLTDRLDRTTGLISTGDRRQPLRLTVDPLSLLAPIGQDGRAGRNTFRAGNMLELNLAASKVFALTTRQHLLFRTEIFNVLNRANFGIPVRLLEAPGFGQATSTVTPGRRVQFALKYSF
jgi:hypothetical protein